MAKLTEAAYFEKFTAREKEAAELLEGAIEGDQLAQYKLKEGIASSDIAAALSPTLNYISLQNYRDQPKVWTGFAERNVLENFLPQPYYNLEFDNQSNIPPGYSGDDFIPGSLPTVKEYAPYPTIAFRASQDSLQVKKSGEGIQFSWESIVNDNQFGLLQRVPTAFGRHAAGLEDSEATKGLVSPTGIGALFTGQALIPTGPLAPLTLPNLEAALTAISNQTYNGVRVNPAQRYALVVPPSLELTAKNILAITEVSETNTSGTTVTAQTRGNSVAGKLNLVVNPWITAINSAATAAWFLIPVPGTSNQNPPILVNFLRGYETPEMWVKDSASYFLGGGKVPERRGSFDNDDYQLRVRHTATLGTLTSAGYIGTLGSP